MNIFWLVLTWIGYGLIGFLTLMAAILLGLYVFERWLSRRNEADLDALCARAASFPAHVPRDRHGFPMALTLEDRMLLYLVKHECVTNVYQLLPKEEINPLTNEEWDALGNQALAMYGLVAHMCDGMGLCEWRLSRLTGKYYKPFNV
ncbi:MAG: hypothetical protein WAX89_01075 [Alphaproteobacteria bacterium]